MKNKIKVYRAMQDLTQEELAKALGVTRQTIIAIENRRLCTNWNFNAKERRIEGNKLKSFVPSRLTISCALGSMYASLPLFSEHAILCSEVFRIILTIPRN